MKVVLTALAATALLSTVSFAAPPPASTASNTMSPIAAATTAAKFTVDTPIETLAADPKANAVLDADFPKMTKHPMYEQFKGMSLKQVQPMSGGKITEAQIAKASADLAAIK